MPNISILSKATFRFYNPNVPKPDPTSKDDLDEQFKQSVVVYAKPEVQTVPAWVKTQKMYEWAVADGDIIEIELKSKPAATKKGEGETEEENDARDETANDAEKLMSMTNAQLIAICVANKIEVPAKVNKAQLLELLGVSKEDAEGQES